MLGDCLLLSSLPGKAWRTLVDSRGLSSDSTCVLKAEPGKLDIKRREPSILFMIIYQFTHLFTLQTIDFDVIIDFCVIQRHWRRH